MSGTNSDLDVVVGCTSGLRFDQIAPWVHSLDACGYRGRRVVIYLRADAETVADLNRRGYETFDALSLHRAGGGILKKSSRDEEIPVNRYYYIWHFLSQVTSGPSPRYLMAMDVRDVIFQRDPSRWLEQNLRGKRIVVGSESMVYENEPWGAKAMQECYGPHVWDTIRRKTIYNSGTIAGEFQTMIDLCLQVYLLSPGDRVLYSDQQALNLLLSSAVYEQITRFASSEDGWACQAGTNKDPNPLRHQTCPEPWFDGEFVRTAAGEIFTIVHHYDRVPELESALKKKYGEVTADSEPRVGSFGWVGRLMRRSRQ